MHLLNHIRNPIWKEKKDNTSHECPILFSHPFLSFSTLTIAISDRCHPPHHHLQPSPPQDYVSPALFVSLAGKNSKHKYSSFIIDWFVKYMGRFSCLFCVHFVEVGWFLKYKSMILLISKIYVYVQLNVVAELCWLCVYVVKYIA